MYTTYRQLMFVILQTHQTFVLSTSHASWISPISFKCMPVRMYEHFFYLVSCMTWWIKTSCIQWNESSKVIQLPPSTFSEHLWCLWMIYSSDSINCRLRFVHCPVAWLCLYLTVPLASLSSSFSRGLRCSPHGPPFQATALQFEPPRRPKTPPYTRRARPSWCPWRPCPSPAPRLPSSTYTRSQPSERNDLPVALGLKTSMGKGEIPVNNV